MTLAIEPSAPAKPSPSTIKAWRDALMLDFPNLQPTVLDWMLSMYANQPELFDEPAKNVHEQQA